MRFNEVVKKPDFRAHHFGFVHRANRISRIELPYPKCAAILASLAREDDLLAVTAALLRRLPPHRGLRQLLNVVTMQ